MKNDISLRRNLRAERYIENFHKESPKEFLQEQAKAILDFDRQNAGNDLSIFTRKNYIRTLKQLAKRIKKPFDEMTKVDIGIFLNEINQTNSANTAQLKKIEVKRFFKFLYGKEEFPEVVRWVSTRKSKRHAEPTKKILTLEERKALLNACRNQKNRAMVTFLDHTGCRAEEAVLTRIKDIEPDKNGKFLTITLGKGKTGRRRVVITEGISDIKLWLNMHPFKNNPDAPFLISYRGTNRFGQLQPDGLNGILNTLKTKAKLKRRVYPHLFRHTRATICGKALKWNEARMRIFFGWVRGSNMPSVYTHMNDDDVNELILQEAGIRTHAEIKNADIKDRECPRCRQKNPFDAKYCNICSLALDSEIAEKHSKITNVSDSIMDISQEKNLKIEQAVEKYVEEFRDRLMKDLRAGAFPTGN